ncbi:tRNA lysidine(34) synthetase TilS [Streptococcus massiliensis]|uniref:tRNA(Ile)-lysidine synthase n=1 Tax=Streptococcus massiliensis TaxID=313439 RepID=A0A380KYS9_9STRE|nr:tRNA lysidine(34) synthetase TilS [Streptococcus massiliensis]SUN76287.1 tRNA(Ile)-lysidine synthetase [Streptococcus massiliensis]
MDQQFLKHVQNKSYFTKHKRVLIALSGGLDSMTLLHFLYQYRKNLEIELVLAHVHHGQRPESDEEAKKLTQYAKQLELPIFVGYFQGKFSEAAGRDFRYRFFKKIMRQENCTALVTAHHANDQAETIFMRLLRGSRVRFLTGIKDCQPFGNGELIRPLLPFQKKEFPKIWHFEDQSNSENTYLRNRIRNQYFPELEQENSQFQEYLVNLATDLNTLQQTVDELTSQLDITDLAFFKSQSQPVQETLLEKYLTNFPDLQLGRAHFEQILHILNKKANYCQPLKNGYELIKDYQRFLIQKIGPRTNSQSREVLLEYGNILEKDGYKFSFGFPLSGDHVTSLVVSHETPVLLRNRESGDFFLKNGHHKKVSRFFIDQKIAQRAREKALIIEQDGQILGIAGLVTGDLSQKLKSDIMKSKLYIQKLDR